MKLLILNVRSFQMFILIVDCHLIIIYQRIANKLGHKVCGLARVTSGMSLSKKRTLMNAFFNSQFNYCPLIWMCHSRENNNKINGLHERCLRIICNDKRSLKHFQRKMAVSIHERNIKILATEMFKVSKNLAPPQMHEIFKLKDQPHYNLRYNSLNYRFLVKSAYKDNESLSFLGA